jgi:hypothetical protein
MQSGLHKILACGRRWGKTDVAAVSLLHDLTQLAKSRQLILAPTVTQAKLLFDRVLDLYEQWSEKTGKVVPVRLKTTPFPMLKLPGHWLQARSGVLGRFLRGEGATRIVVDEAAFVDEALISEVAFPMLATSHGSMSLISTPRGHNHFWRYFQLGKHGQRGFWSQQARTEDAPHISPNFLAMQRELLTDRAYRTEYEAEFVDLAGMVFDLERVNEACVDRLPECAGGPISIGVDWARYRDRTVVAFAQGHRDQCQVWGLEVISGLGWLRQIERVGNLLKRYSYTRVLCDATGVGDPALEMLQDFCFKHNLVHDIHPYVFTSSSKQALIENLIWTFEKGALKMLRDEELMREFEAYEYQGQAGVHAKFGARSGCHDDRITALALAVMGLPDLNHGPIGVGRARGYG